MAASQVQKLSGMPSPNMVFNAQMNTKGQSTTNATPNTMRGTMNTALNPFSLPMVNFPHTFSFTSPRYAGPRYLDTPLLGVRAPAGDATLWSL